MTPLKMIHNRRWDVGGGKDLGFGWIQYAIHHYASQEKSGRKTNV